MDNDVDVTIFTDGACLRNPGPGGFAAVIKTSEKTETISGAFRLTTNNRMELMAVIAALNYLADKEGLSIRIYTDSKLIVDAFNQNWIRNWEKKNWKKKEGNRVLNVDLWKRLLTLAKPHMIEFVWVKGHSGIKENEQCDKIARQLASEPILPPDIEYEEEYALINQHMTQQILDSNTTPKISDDFQMGKFQIRLHSDEEQMNFTLIIKSSKSYLYSSFFLNEFNELSEIIETIKDRISNK